MNKGAPPKKKKKKKEREREREHKKLALHKYNTKLYDDILRLT